MTVSVNTFFGTSAFIIGQRMPCAGCANAQIELNRFLKALPLRTMNTHNISKTSGVNFSGPDKCISVNYTSAVPI